MASEIPIKSLDIKTKTSAITAADVKANRQRFLQVSDGDQKKLIALMNSNFKGILTDQEYQGFVDYEQTFVNHFLDLESVRDVAFLKEIIEDVVKYSIGVTNSSGAAFFLNLYKKFKPQRSEKEMDKAYYAAWTNYLLDGLYFASDDVLDGSTMRRFKPAYFVTTSANATWQRSMLVFQLMVEGLAAKFNDEPWAFEILRTFSYHLSRGTVGQSIDFEGGLTRKVRFDKHTRIQHNLCMTGPVYNLPFEMAALMTGRKLTSEEVQLTRELGFAICSIFRDNNDFTDVYPHAPHGKPLYVDIAAGTTTWLSCAAWQLANEQQRQILEENYGFDDDDKIAKVIQVYNQVDVRSHYQKEMAVNAQRLKRMLEKLPEHLAPKEVFQDVMSYATDQLSYAWA